MTSKHIFLATRASRVAIKPARCWFPASWLFMLTLFVALSSSRSAWAYSWMIRHGYTGCVTCHTDPSGAGLLTPYGRAQSDLLLRTRYTGGTPEEADKTAGPAWGLISPPDWLLVGGQFRGLGMLAKFDKQQWGASNVLMQADLGAQISVGGFRANGSLGVVQSSASRASVVGSVVSREHWLGYSFDDDAFLVRAGRMNLPFGLRIIEHTMFVRSATRTDINDNQQHGLSFAYSSEFLRGEVMGILGNYQLSPDAYRERGYSGYVEVTPLGRTALGLSSLVTHSSTDIFYQVADTRQAHGAFVRVSPWPVLALLAESDLVINSPRSLPTETGLANLLMLDAEPIQGVHLLGAVESYKQKSGEGASWALWAGSNWFFAPHADLRLDVLRRSDAAGNIRLNSTALLAQMHVFL